MKPDESKYFIKYFVSNAAEEVPAQTPWLADFSRWRAEGCFKDQKREVKLDQWDGRRWLECKRHLIITSVSHLFVARVREKPRRKTPDLTMREVQQP